MCALLAETGGSLDAPPIRAAYGQALTAFDQLALAVDAGDERRMAARVAVLKARMRRLRTMWAAPTPGRQRGEARPRERHPTSRRGQGRRRSTTRAGPDGDSEPPPTGEPAGGPAGEP